MYIVKTSPRAFFVALLCLLLFHGMLFFMALLGTQTKPPMFATPTPDRALGMLLLRVALDAAGLTLGHFICRGAGIGSRAAYGIIGGLAGALGYALSIQHGLMFLPVYQGATFTAGILPVLAGMIAGFLYGQFAGREKLHHVAPTASENPPEIAPLAKATPPEAVPSIAAAPTGPFDGPVQVRTSIAALTLASLVPALLITVVFFALSYGMLSGLQESPNEPLKIVWSQQIIALAFQAQMFILTAAVTALPGAVLALLAHALARALRWTTGLAYAGAGALVGLAFGFSLIPFGGWPSFPFTGVSFLILPLAAFGAIMMAVYRRFAGLEPRPLPEPVLATDAEALVPADHPARRGHAVVFNG